MSKLRNAVGAGIAVAAIGAAPLAITASAGSAQAGGVEQLHQNAGGVEQLVTHGVTAASPYIYYYGGTRLGAKASPDGALEGL